MENFIVLIHQTQQELGRTVISKENALNYKYLDDNKLEENKSLENGHNNNLEKK